MLLFYCNHIIIVHYCVLFDVHCYCNVFCIVIVHCYCNVFCIVIVHCDHCSLLCYIVIHTIVVVHLY